MLPLFWRSPLSNKLFGTALLGLCLSTSLQAQDTPLATPKNVDYPGIIQTFEKIIQIDSTKFKNKSDQLVKNGKVLEDAAAVTNLDLDPDFLNSIILHSNPGYLKLASTNRCRFYDSILTDLLRSSEGKIKNVLVTYVAKNGQRQSSMMSRKDFLNKVVNQDCPETQGLISQFQVKSLDKTLSSTLFEVPAGREQCQMIHLNWLNNPKTPYFCQIHEYIKEARAGGGDPKDLTQRKAVAKILDQKLNLIQKDYIDNICNNLDQEEHFCDEFLNVSYWSKIAGGYADKIYVDNICQRVSGSANPSDVQIKQCLARLKKENDLCLYGAGRGIGLSPQPECDTLSLALNHSSLRSNYKDCPGNSDQMAVTNLARTYLNITKEEIKSSSGPCSAVSSAAAIKFNTTFDNDENWHIEACYHDRLLDRENCIKTFFGSYGNNPLSYTSVVADILKSTRGADPSTSCRLVDSQDYNPLLLEYKSGCVIVYERNKCFMGQCTHKILFNDRPIDFISLKGKNDMEYFPLSVKTERFSQHFLMTRDFKQTGRSLNNITNILNFFKKNTKGIMYGVGCGEDILPSFFRTQSLNQCTPLPFIIDGMIGKGDKVAFVTRTAADSLQAPRLVSWSYIFSAVKSYQTIHPLKLWTLYGLD